MNHEKQYSPALQNEFVPVWFVVTKATAEQSVALRKTIIK